MWGMALRSIVRICVFAVVVIPAVALARQRHTPAARRPPTDIFTAIERGDLARVKAFLDAGVNINAVDGFGYSPVHTASSNHQDAILSYLIDKGADVNLPDGNSGATLLHYVADFNQLAAAKAALARGGSLAIEDRRGNQPLWTAVFNDKGRSERIDIVKLFIEHGADADHKNRFGKSPKDFVKLAHYDNLRAVMRMN